MQFMTQIAETGVADEIIAYRPPDNLVEDPVHLDKYDDTDYDNGKGTADNMPAEGFQMVHERHFFLVRVSIK
jgi:hypothetical protein